MFWFNRMTEHWVVPQRLDLVEHVRRGRLQVVQTGTFGPQFYGLADDPQVPRHWCGMPLVGVTANLEYIEDLIARLHENGARVIGQMSMSWHYGDHLQGKGLFGLGQRLWDEYLEVPAPDDNLALMQQQVDGGALRRWPIEGRPYQTYSGCMCNPQWLMTLKAMLCRAVRLGVDGMIAHHNFESFCACRHCREYLARWLEACFTPAERSRLFGHAGGVDRRPLDDCPVGLKERFNVELQRAAQHRRKEAFDELCIEYGRSLKNDLLVGQWYHKYDFKPSDERSLLPAGMWARDEDFIWYSQGANKGISAVEHGYLADMGLPARFVHAAGGGRPFVINKYDYRRWRLSIAEAAAHHAAALAFHWSQDDDPDFATADYLAPVCRYHAFLASQEPLIHPAQSWSQIGLVYPRRAETAGESACTDALRRLGRLLEDGHALFDLIIDEQLETRCSDYPLLVLPDIQRLTDAEMAVLEQQSRRGTRLLCTGATGSLQADGTLRSGSPLRDAPGVAWMDDVPASMQTIQVLPGTEVPVYPLLDQDAFGQDFLRQVKTLTGTPWLRTDAPWYVRVRAWRPAGSPCLVVHWVNYRQDETADIETPLPVGPLRVHLRPPAERTVTAVDWRYPERRDSLVLEHTTDAEGMVCFDIPQLIVYGLSVLHLGSS